MYLMVYFVSDPDRAYLNNGVFLSQLKRIVVSIYAEGGDGIYGNVVLAIFEISFSVLC